MGVSMGEVFNTLQVYLGSLYINDFNRFGRTWQVNVQAAARLSHPARGFEAGSRYATLQGQMVPLAAICKVREVSGPVHGDPLQHVPAAADQRQRRPPASVPDRPWSNGEVGAGRACPVDAVGMDGTGSAATANRQHGHVGLRPGRGAGVSGAGGTVRKLVAAAGRDSRGADVPALLDCRRRLAHMDINIFTQVGFVVLVGLACKNAILIVEFAKAQREAGVPPLQATLEACKLRLRPIIMTSFAFILGVVPLMISQGAGAEMRRTLGTAVFAGMLGVTIFGIFLTPVFFYVIQWVTDMRQSHKKPKRSPAAPAH